MRQQKPTTSTAMMLTVFGQGAFIALTDKVVGKTDIDPNQAYWPDDRCRSG